MRGPLAGLPIAIKDNMVTEGVTTTCASRILHNYSPSTPPPRCAGVGRPRGHARQDQHGRVRHGFVHRELGFPTTRNPWDLATVPGGSSGGSAAAVAAGEALWALGSDTGGSIRQPAALCGIVGMKPTYGAVSRYGLIAFASSLDQIGPLTRSVYDCALLLQHIVGRDPMDSTSVELPAEIELPTAERLDGLRVGVPSEYLGAGRRARRARPLRRDAARASSSSAALRGDQPAAHRVRSAGLLHHRAGRGERQPGALRRRALWLSRRRRRRPHRDVRAHRAARASAPRSSGAS